MLSDYVRNRAGMWQHLPSSTDCDMLVPEIQMLGNAMRLSAIALSICVLAWPLAAEAEDCTGENCASKQNVEECSGENCLPPTENGVEDCEGENCTPEPKSMGNPFDHCDHDEQTTS